MAEWGGICDKVAGGLRRLGTTLEDLCVSDETRDRWISLAGHVCEFKEMLELFGPYVDDDEGWKYVRKLKSDYDVCGEGEDY